LDSPRINSASATIEKVNQLERQTFSNGLLTICIELLITTWPKRYVSTFSNLKYDRFFILYRDNQWKEKTW
jgi:hypothetical protein